MEIQPREDDPGTQTWRTHTIAYDYSVYGAEDDPRERFSYHFHPESGVEFPHLHVNVRPVWVRKGLRKKHLATGRVSIEDFIQVLVEEFDVTPRRKDWRDVLEENRRIFSQRKTW